MEAYSAESAALIWPQSGWDGKTLSIAKSIHSGAKYLIIIGQTQQVMKTSQKQISLFGEDKSTSSLEGSPVSRSASQGSEKAQRTNAIYGRKCLEQLEKLSQVGSWAKTFAGLLVGTGDWYSSRCRLTWKLQGTKSSRFYFQLQASTPRTKGTGSGLLLKTPTVMDGEVSSGKKNPKSGDSGTLAQEIMSGYKPTMEKLGLLPTPIAGDWKGQKRSDGTASMLSGKVAIAAKEGMLPTPHAGEPGKTSQLNPRFVAEMMGFPPTHTEEPFKTKIQWIDLN